MIPNDDGDGENGQNGPSIIMVIMTMIITMIMTRILIRSEMLTIGLILSIWRNILPMRWRIKSEILGKLLL